jgi:hypothetical protein
VVRLLLCKASLCPSDGIFLLRIILADLFFLIPLERVGVGGTPSGSRHALNASVCGREKILKKMLALYFLLK